MTEGTRLPGRYIPSFTRETDKHKFLRGLPKYQDIGNEFGLIEAARLVASEEQWLDYKDVGYEPKSFPRGFAGEDMGWRYHHLEELQDKLFVLIKEKIEDGSWTVQGNLSGSTDWVKIDYRHFDLFPNLFREPATAGSLRFENLIFSSTKSSPRSRSQKEDDESRAVEWLQRWANKQLNRVSVSCVEIMLNGQFPNANFSDRQHKRIRNKAGLRKLGIIGPGPFIEKSDT